VSRSRRRHGAGAALLGVAPAASGIFPHNCFSGEGEVPASLPVPRNWRSDGVTLRGHLAGLGGDAGCRFRFPAADCDAAGRELKLPRDRVTA
jgi:hypothetical protein